MGIDGINKSKPPPFWTVGEIEPVINASGWSFIDLVTAPNADAAPAAALDPSDARRACAASASAAFVPTNLPAASPAFSKLVISGTWASSARTPAAPFATPNPTDFTVPNTPNPTVFTTPATFVPASFAASTAGGIALFTVGIIFSTDDFTFPTVDVIFPTVDVIFDNIFPAGDDLLFTTLPGVFPKEAL